jgi:PqqA peptide cyclase
MRCAATLTGDLVIHAGRPDDFAKYPKACMGGWGKPSLSLMPSGRVLPCHAAQSIPPLEFWNVPDRRLAEIWAHSPGFAAVRGRFWIKEPCTSSGHREPDFGGRRCQAFTVLGDARPADPLCQLSPHHAPLLEPAQADSGEEAFLYRAR